MHVTRRFAWLVVSAAAVSMASQASASDFRASVLADTCNACHGPDGSTYGPATPSIAGVNADYLIDTMNAYKTKARQSTIMGRIARGYTDEEIKIISNYFAKQKLVRQVSQKTDGMLADKGQELTRKYCEGCHEKDGYSGVDYPSLAGQPLPYLTYQISDFYSGARNIDNNPSMSSKEKKKKKRNLADLKDAEGQKGIDAVINFYGSRK